MFPIPIHRAILVVLLAVNVLPACTQNLSALYELFGEDDKKSIDKAIEQIREAGKLTQEANAYYNELLALQTNYELSEKALQKKLSKAESNAIKRQIKADKIYTETYADLFKLCEQKLRESKTSYGETGSLESEASRLIGKAAEKRQEANTSDDAIKKVATLNEAASLDNAALDNMILALQVEMGIVPESATTEYLADYNEQPVAASPTEKYIQEPTYTSTPSAVATNTTQLSENLAINNGLIADYTRYVNNSAIPEPITINRSGVHGLDEVSVEKAREILQKNTAPAPVLHEDNSSAALAEESPDAALTARNNSSDNIQAAAPAEFTETSATEGISITSEEASPKQLAPPPDQLLSTRSYTDISATPQRNDVVFSVQIAASRVPLTRSQVWAIYSGNQTIEVVKEDGWFKYRVSGFRLYSQAQRVADESGVNGAWVLATMDGQSIDLPEAREMTKLLETNTNRHGQAAIGQSTDYYVQVAASRLRLSDQILNRICLEKSLCREVIEEGWYKYQVYAGTNLNTAYELKNRFRPEAFIVGYVNGSKTNIYNR